MPCVPVPLVPQMPALPALPADLGSVWSALAHRVH